MCVWLQLDRRPQRALARAWAVLARSSLSSLLPSHHRPLPPAISPRRRSTTTLETRRTLEHTEGLAGTRAVPIGLISLRATAGSPPSTTMPQRSGLCDALSTQVLLDPRIMRRYVRTQILSPCSPPASLAHRLAQRPNSPLMSLSLASEQSEQRSGDCVMPRAKVHAHEQQNISDALA
ncbi:hypothetical protein CC78DRAFT_130755 [Lojkania enalia]|uniref:Uncharacterized protein n=1 Tax=Lojkania enalia TaxID=147567 RepID=A0A9P4NC00_9PLEO|nr:hypothetical protein CC78DRAFT_130755 [Didymosphaeria enalia]